MTEKIHSLISFGSNGLVVDIECSFSNSLPGIVIVGSATKSVDEAKERLRSAFNGNGLNLPRKRITINLAPADIPKTDSGLDLAMAASILLASRQIKVKDLDKSAFIGEVGLDGSIRSVRGIIGKLLSGRDKGLTNFYIAPGNLPQARLVPGIRLFPFSSLKEMVNILDGQVVEPKALETREGTVVKNEEESSVDPFVDIVGQAIAKRALEIAAAGGHNVLFSGPPGTGKSMLAKALPKLLPAMSQEEILQVSQLHSLTSSDFDRPVTKRPFRSPHHSASHISITGGGHNLRPGEISLSHRGVLFLDELPEFNRMTLEALRQPLEERTISVARAKDTVDYPANFILIATANPCPCGYYGSSKPCNCLPYQISRYQQRLSGPILDRIDLFASVHEVEHARLLGKNNLDSIDFKNRIDRARQAQNRRYGSTTKLNADMNNADIKKLSQLTADAKDILDTAAQRLDLSARSYMRMIKLARTIADLDDSPTILQQHITEALQFRPKAAAL